MHWLLFTLKLAAGIDPQVRHTPDEARLAALVEAIERADYRGERDSLRRLEAGLDAVKAPALASSREYWRGFALWRRALNGFNETPTPPDLRDDLEAALKAFGRALDAQPGWVEARLGIAGCGSNLIYLAGDDKARRDAVLADFIPVFRQLVADAPDNPRVLWLRGGSLLAVKGDVAGAVDLYRRGLAAARAEALATPAPPPWTPTWGGPENLMSLAWTYSHGARIDRALAEAYADGALCAVPDWHYVSAILVPQIEALPRASP